MHRDGFPIEQGRPILPLAERVFRGLMQERWAGNDSHGRDASVDVNKGVNHYVAGHVLIFSHEGISRRHLADQSCRPYIATDRNRNFGSRRLFFISRRKARG